MGSSLSYGTLRIYVSLASMASEALAPLGGTMPAVARKALAVLGAAALVVSVFAIGAHHAAGHRADSGTTDMYHHG